ATKYICLPWFKEGRDLYVIMADPTNVVAADAIAFRTGWRVKPGGAPGAGVPLAVQRFYGAGGEAPAPFGNTVLGAQLSIATEIPETEGDEEEDVEKGAQAAPLVKLVNAIFADAIRAGASDIHIEPQEKGLNLRYRVDGLLRNVTQMPRRLQNKVISR